LSLAQNLKHSNIRCLILKKIHSLLFKISEVLNLDDNNKLCHSQSEARLRRGGKNTLLKITGSADPAVSTCKGPLPRVTGEVSNGCNGMDK
jgi:hypothetical protein